MKKRIKYGNNNKFVKSLSVAALAGLTFFGAQANAQGVNAEDNPSLTFGEGKITGAAAPTPTLGDDSAYTLTEVESATSGTNVITIPQYNESSQALENKYYQLDLTKTQYGKADGDTSVDYTIQAPNDYNINVKFNTSYGEGDTTWTSEPVTILGNEYTINAKYDSSRVLSRISNTTTRDAINWHKCKNRKYHR